MFGDDVLVGGQGDAGVPDLNRLIDLTDQAHLDSTFALDEGGMVTELAQVEIGAGVVESAQDVQVEGSSDTERVVVGRLDELWVLLPVDAHEQATALPYEIGNAAEEGHGLFVGEVSDRAPGEVRDGASARAMRARQTKRLCVVRADRDHFHVVVAVRELIGGRLERSPADVDQHATAGIDQRV